MKYQVLTVALAAAFAIALLPQTSEAGNGRPGGGGGWIANGSALTGLPSDRITVTSSATIKAIALPRAQ